MGYNYNRGRKKSYVRTGNTIRLSGNRGRKGLGGGKLWILLLIAGVIGLAVAFKPNAYQVSIGDQVLGIVKEQAVADGAKDTVLTMLKDEYGANVKTDDQVKVKKVRASKKKVITPEYLIANMRKNMNVLIEFKEVAVDGKTVGILRSQEEVDELLGRLRKRYIKKTKSNADLQVAFADNVTVRNLYAKENELTTVDALYEKGIETTEKEVVYEVVQGDTLWGITNKLGVTQLKLEKSNPGVTATLRIGQELTVMVDEQFIRVEPIPLPAPTKEGEGKEGTKDEKKAS